MNLRSRSTHLVHIPEEGAEERADLGGPKAGRRMRRRARCGASLATKKLQLLARQMSIA
jgi:hypothetical protein